MELFQSRSNSDQAKLIAQNTQFSVEGVSLYCISNLGNMYSSAYANLDVGKTAFLYTTEEGDVKTVQ